MPKIIKIGPSTKYVGKTLWEILGNLRNLGVGRIVRRSIYERYPEPTYYRILKVDTLPPPQKTDDARKVRAYTERVFRGRKFEKIYEICQESWAPDFTLVPKSEEKALLEKAEASVYLNKKTVPQTISFPPLLKELIIQDRKARGLPVDEEPRMKLVIREEEDQLYRITQDGEAPSVNYDGGKGTPKTPQLYEIPQLFKEKLNLS
ncbi:28S ribosomal protein S34, mitochondrial-like [Macrosteles quadrilineatus]|uniref:28S ribosomal protein S34, mitochondrial-like n=1 Tax=Macrosteles quadrilineatus TaxID=74068 RepID=UPI0023E1661B|nr:28S ribosomal protein S34, mitochondrial-like [Macrosteles quadrilineatus]